MRMKRPRAKLARIAAATIATLALTSGCIDEIDSGEISPSGVPQQVFLDNGMMLQDSNLELRLSQLFYGAGDRVSAVLQGSNGAILRDDQVAVLLVGASGQDLEYLIMQRSGEPGVYVSVDTIPILAQDGTTEVTQYDGSLVLQPQEILTALYYPNHATDGAVLSGEQVVPDFAFMEDPTMLDTGYHVDARIALTDDERDPPAGGKPLGTLASASALPVQLPTDELILQPRDLGQLQRVLAELGGAVTLTDTLRTEPSGPDNPLVNDAGPQPEPPTLPDTVLMHVDNRSGDLAHLAQARALFGETDVLMASNEDVLRIYALAMELRLEGFIAGVNPRMQYHGVPTTPDDIMQNLTNDRFAIPEQWAFMALWDADTRVVPVAFLDMGFALNPDFRGFETPESIRQCDLEGANLVDGLTTGISCGPRIAESVPTVGASFFGPDTWHGTGMVTTAGGVLNNGQSGASNPGRDHAFAAGPAGQVMQPMLYRFGLASYAFEMGLGMMQATVDGAAVINVSAGYPCRLVTNVLINPNICTVGGRAALCTVLTVALTAATATVCAAAAATAAIPIVGPALAAALSVACATATVATVAATTACFATLVAGNVDATMARGVNFASDRGVAVVTSAGNTINADNLPDIIADVLDVDNIDADEWGIIPCVIDGSICVGATDSTSPWSNVHFMGASVDIWAPIRAQFYAPPTTTALAPFDTHVATDVGGTSAAAAYVSGMIAVLQSLDPTLDPTTPILTAAQRAAIPERIRRILTTTAYTSTHPVDPLPGDPNRRNLINPGGAVDLVASAALPDFAARGYDDQLDFDEISAAAARDTRSDRQVLRFGETVTATIVTIPPARAAGRNVTDVDCFGINIGPRPSGLYEVTFELLQPRDFGEVIVVGADMTLAASEMPGPSADERRTLYTTPALFPGSEVVVWVRSPAGSRGADNVYKLQALEPVRVADAPDPDRFDVDDAAVNPPESRPNNDVCDRAVHLGIAGMPWVIDGGGGLRPAHRLDVTDLNFHHPGDVDWFSIRNLPPYGDYDSVGCQPYLEIEFGDHMRLVLTNAGGADVYTATTSPAVIPVSYVTEPVTFRVEPLVSGVFVEYDLHLQFIAPPASICRFEFLATLEELASFQRMHFPRFVPDNNTAVPDFLTDFTNPAVNPGQQAAFDEAGRFIVPDVYALPELGSVRIVAEMTKGASLALTLVDANAAVVAQVLTPDLDVQGNAGSAPLITLQLDAGHLEGDHFLLISHGTLGTQLDVHMIDPMSQ
jgi:hypothetical protein